MAVRASVEDVEQVVYPLVRMMDQMRRAQARILDPTRQALLQAAAIRGPVRPSELARELGVAQSSVTRQVRILDDAGFVIIEPDPTDGRSCLVSLSEAGWAEARRLTGLGVQAFQDFLAGWDLADVRALGTLLARLEESIAKVREQRRPATGRRWQQPKR